jgi:hypothetical protein
VSSTPRRSARPYSIEAQHPDTFLVHLFHVAPPVIVEALREQAAALKWPATPLERVLDALEQHAPVFVSQVREYLHEEKTVGESSSPG